MKKWILNLDREESLNIQFCWLNIDIPSSPYSNPILELLTPLQIHPEYNPLIPLQFQSQYSSPRKL